jgi:hypothetical protein
MQRLHIRLYKFLLIFAIHARVLEFLQHSISSMHTVFDNHNYALYVFSCFAICKLITTTTKTTIKTTPTTTLLPKLHGMLINGLAGADVHRYET